MTVVEGFDQLFFLKWKNALRAFLIRGFVLVNAATYIVQEATHVVRILGWM